MFCAPAAIPVHEADLFNTIPDERSVLTFVSFLATRLLALHREQQAAACIQVRPPPSPPARLLCGEQKDERLRE